jgi:hypothetical protein
MQMGTTGYDGCYTDGEKDSGEIGKRGLGR